MRRATALAMCASLALVSTSLTASATEPPSHFPPGSTIVLYDRTTDPRATDAIQYAIGIWNGVGANFTLTYQRGPGDNFCAPRGADDPNTIGICLEVSGSNGGYGRYPYYPLDGTGHTRNGYASQCTDPPCAGLSEARRIIPHEIGHVLGLGHTPPDATGACSIMSIECYSLVPNQNDRDHLRSLYGHTHGGTTTTTAAQATTSTTLATTTTSGPGGTTTTTTNSACRSLAQHYAATSDPAARAAIRQQQAYYGCTV